MIENETGFKKKKNGLVQSGPLAKNKANSPASSPYVSGATQKVQV